jgi:hypothetical protein
MLHSKIQMKTKKTSISIITKAFTPKKMLVRSFNVLKQVPTSNPATSVKGFIGLSKKGDLSRWSYTGSRCCWMV